MSLHKLGALPDDPSVPRVSLAQHAERVTSTALPASVSWSNIPAIGMLLNDQWGDCVWASDGHICEILSYFGQGAEVVITEDTVLRGYESIGFDPNAGPSGDNPTDQGSLLTQGLDYLVSQGMQGVKIDAYAEIDVHDVNLLKTALAELGPVDLALSLPASAEDQFAAGQPWTYTGDQNILGGHCVTGVGYDDKYLYIHTWGQVQKVEWQFYMAYFNQAFALVSREWINSTSTLDPEHVNLASLGDAFAQISGGSNPFSPAPSHKGCKLGAKLRKLFKK